ncbi:alpha/beta hydrolase [Qipengyuania sp. DGS5-3]|uniref:alpha/beta hydrolase n=1 Tax=Qipengyuania sp. DGS5-3 TaxID=3349632 RepID=UPI0036D23A47
MLATLGVVAVCYIAFAALVTLAQGKLIYPAPSGPGVDVPGFERITYTTEDGLEISAGYRAADPGQPTIVYFHGNGADWQSSVVATDRLVPLGYGVLAAEYRGYRGNPGTPREAGLYADGRAALAFLEERGVAASEVVLIGNSIGSGTATQLATEINPRALILISPFASLTRVVGEKIWWLPTKLLLRDRYENAAKIGDVAAPTLILHGDADTLIPHAHSETLAAASPNAELAIFPGAGHDLAWQDAAEMRVAEFLIALDAEE